MENLKEEVVNLFCEYRAFECGSDMQLENKAQELTDKLIAIFDRERKKYALRLFQEYAQRLDKVLGLDDNDSKIIRENFPSELQPGVENEK